MVDATHTTTHTELDPTLALLVPQRSRGRGAALVGIALVGVIALWASYGVLRPTVASSSGGASWTALPMRDQVATIVQLDPSGWSRSFRSVTDVQGAEVAGAWLFPVDEVDLGDTVQPLDHVDGLAFLEAAFAADDFSTRQLPQRVPRNGPSQLVVLWNITDCALLVSSPGPRAELVTWVGTTVHQSFDDFLRPGSDMSTLVETGICP